MMSKVDVNGSNGAPAEMHGLRGCQSDAQDLKGRLTCACLAESPVFTYLKQQQPGFGLPMIKWNFSKFLVDREGRVVKRCVPIPEHMTLRLQLLLLLLLLLMTNILMGPTYS